MYASKVRRKTCRIEVCCSPAEKRYIEIRARGMGLSVSEFLRDIGLRDSPEQRKTLPPEVLAFNGELCGIAGGLEIIARKRLDSEDLDSLERAQLNFLARGLKLLIEKIKSYLI